MFLLNGWKTFYCFAVTLKKRESSHFLISSLRGGWQVGWEYTNLPEQKPSSRRGCLLFPSERAPSRKLLTLTKSVKDEFTEEFKDGNTC